MTIFCEKVKIILAVAATLHWEVNNVFWQQKKSCLVIVLDAQTSGHTGSNKTFTGMAIPFFNEDCKLKFAGSEEECKLGLHNGKKT